MDTDEVPVFKVVRRIALPFLIRVDLCPSVVAKWTLGFLHGSYFRSEADIFPTGASLSQ